MKPALTVFTPTYNRAYTLHLCYESLLRQTSKNFVWLIVDDGSADETKQLVNSWIEENQIPIRYHYQANQGMHGAHNSAYQLIDTELNVCIDSDDYMPDDAVEKILAAWEQCDKRKYAGIAGLDAKPNGDIIGTHLPENMHAATLSDLYGKHKVKGDKKLVYRSELTKQTPAYPVFPGEKYCPLSYKYILIDQQYPLLLLNEVLCHVEYLEDGSSLNMVNQYRKNPKGFAFFRKSAMKYAPTYKDEMREAVHYVSSSLISKNYHFLQESPRKLTTFFASPIGFLLFVYIQKTNRTTVMKSS